MRGGGQRSIYGNGSGLYFGGVAQHEQGSCGTLTRPMERPLRGLSMVLHSIVLLPPKVAL